MKDTPAAVTAAPEAAATTATVEVPAEGAKPAAPQSPSIFGSPMIMMLFMIGILYFMMIRPQQRREKERRKMIDELRAGAKVIFAGGIVGTIVEATEKAFIVETVSGRMEVLRSAVQGVASADEPAKK